MQRLLPRATVTLMQGASKITGRASACCFKTKILSSPSMVAGSQGVVRYVTSNIVIHHLPLFPFFPLSPLFTSPLHLLPTLPTKIQSSTLSLLFLHFDSPRSLSLAELFNRFTRKYLSHFPSSEEYFTVFPLTH